MNKNFEKKKVYYLLGWAENFSKSPYNNKNDNNKKGIISTYHGK